MADNNIADLSTEELEKLIQKKQKKLEKYEKRLAVIEEKVEQTIAKLEKLKGEKEKLNGYWEFNKKRGGEICDLFLEICALEAEKELSTHPCPVWLVEPKMPYPAHRILEVTPRRIYLQRRGVPHSAFWSRGVGSMKGYESAGTLDVPETLKAWKQYQENLKP